MDRFKKLKKEMNMDYYDGIMDDSIESMAKRSHEKENREIEQAREDARSESFNMLTGRDPASEELEEMDFPRTEPKQFSDEVEKYRYKALEEGLGREPSDNELDALQMEDKEFETPEERVKRFLEKLKSSRGN